MRPVDWYEEPGTPDIGTWWWALEHRGHPAFYLRALMPGDFAPGTSGPLARHVADLSGAQVAEGKPVTCGTCGQTFSDDDDDYWDVVERQTGALGFLDALRSGKVRWPGATDPAACWLCSAPRKRAYLMVETPGGRARACEQCAAYLTRGR